MIRQPPRVTLTDTLLPSTTPFRSPRNSELAAGFGKNRGRQSFGASASFQRQIHQIDAAGQPDGRHADAGNISSEKRLAMSQRSEEHTYELKSLMRISYAVFCLKTKNQTAKN